MAKRQNKFCVEHQFFKGGKCHQMLANLSLENDAMKEVILKSGTHAT